MLASSFLDIAIGIVFVFLLLSVIASTINEIILSYLNLRGRMLLDGIKTLLNDNAVAADGLVHLLYNHGQIFGLFKGNFNPTAKWWDKLPIFRDKAKVDLPSYIPSGSFANAFLGVLAAKAPDEARTNWDASKQAAVQSVATAKAANDRANSILSNAASAQTDKDAAQKAAAAAQLAADSANLAANIAFFQLLEGVAQGMCANNDKVGKPLLAIIETADNDITKLKSSLETWYNSAMDRVSGWYKYRTQWVLFWIGLVLAIALNANTVNIIRQISTNDTLRQSLVAEADKAKLPDSAVTSQWQSNHVYTIGDKICSNAAGCPSASKDVQVVAAVTGSGKSGSSVPTWPATSGKTVDAEVTWATAEPQNRYQEVASQISAVKDLGLPLGWRGSSISQGWWPVFCSDERVLCLERNNKGIAISEFSRDNTAGWPVLFGWVLTAVAISLGAPFWFDLLNKFMVVRSTIKPHEKSKEEGSKDKQP